MISNSQQKSQQDTTISTPEILQMNLPSHVYTYIHTYMEKRINNNNNKTITNVIFYDGLTELKDLCLRNNTNVSSVVSNLIREFLLLYRSKTPQKTLFDFGDSETVMDFFHEKKIWDAYIREASSEKKEEIKQQIILIDKSLTRNL